MTRQMMTGRRWAYVGAVLGAAVSVAANVAHSFVPPDGAAPGWTPHAGSVGMSAFWPLAVLVAVEILARVAWPAGGRWVLLRWAGLMPVAIVAAVVSYRHLSALLAFYGDDPLTAALGPLAVDGLMVMATGALIATSGRPAVAEPETAPVAEPEPVRSGAVAPSAGPDTVPAATEPSEPVTARQRPAQQRKQPAARREPAPVGELLLVGQAVAEHLERQGESLTRAALIAGLRERGHAVSTNRATELLRQLKAA